MLCEKIQQVKQDESPGVVREGMGPEEKERATHAEMGVGEEDEHMRLVVFEEQQESWCQT